MSFRSKPVIGVTPAFDEGVKLPASQASFYLRREYTNRLASVGAVPVILTPDMHLSEITELCDGIVISGGEDIPAEVYGGEALLTVPEPLERIMWERLLIDRCAEHSIPVLGVCYGMQLLALHFGGALYQDITNEVSGSANHVLTMHDVSVTEDFLGIAQGTVLSVASRHHQAVAVMPDKFKLCARAPDGVIEAMSNGNFYGVQWHPESDDSGNQLYAAFVERCIASSTQL